ncbi:UNVERIFIED_CONTAM: hypothetical protein NCL1_52770 [Trichonephila clavipes]
MLHHHFVDDRIISRDFPTAWPPRSPDSNPWDFGLWGYLKATVYHDPITSLFDLKESIECHVRYIPKFMLPSTIEHATLRFQRVTDNGGQSSSNTIYQT